MPLPPIRLRPQTSASIIASTASATGVALGTLFAPGFVGLAALCGYGLSLLFKASGSIFEVVPGSTARSLGAQLSWLGSNFQILAGIAQVCLAGCLLVGGAPMFLGLFNLFLGLTILLPFLLSLFRSSNPGENAASGDVVTTAQSIMPYLQGVSVIIACLFLSLTAIRC